MSKTVKRIWNIVTSVIVGLVVALAIALVGVRLLGYQVYTVLSPSMEPNLPVGAIIYVRSEKPESYAAGDAITFMVNETTVVTHRVTRIQQDPADPNTLWFYTQGDANSIEDTNPVHYRNVLGKVVFHIPYLGYVADYVQKPPGLYVAIGVGAVLLVLAFLPTGRKKQGETTV